LVRRDIRHAFFFLYDGRHLFAGNAIFLEVSSGDQGLQPGGD
jgi:hypothetical protein